jgi:membrane-bound lytic murein transglycosylase D
MSYAYYYFPMIEEELINAGIPVELRTLAVVESGLNPLATSHMGAKGLWQFMPATGRSYGLEINSLVDER